MTQTSFSGEKDDGSLPQLLPHKEEISLNDLYDLDPSTLVVLEHCLVALSSGSKTPESYKEEVISRIQTCLKDAKLKKKLHNILQLTIFIGAALVTVTLAVPDVPKVVPILLASIVTVATAIANYYKFGERGRDIFLVAEELGLEHNRFDTMRGIYKNLSPEDAFALFMDRVEVIIHEDTKRCFALERTTVEPKTGLDRVPNFPHVGGNNGKTT